MRRLATRRRAAAAVLGVFLAAALGGLVACSVVPASTTRQTPSSPPGTAGIGTPTTVPAAGPFNVSLTTQYALNRCDAGEPANAICLATSGSGQGVNNGQALKLVNVQRTSAYAPGDGSACTPATTKGTLQFTQSDTATFTGTGTFCRATQVATFTYTIVGGTGAYAGASGTGTIYVPPPSSETDDAETWSGSLLT